MQAKPLFFTFLAIGAFAYMADVWLIGNQSTRIVTESSSFPAIPARVASPDTLVEPPAAALSLEDSLLATQSLAERLKELTLTAKIEKRLFRSKLVRPYGLEIEVSAGAVTVKGQVLTEDIGRQIERIVSRVPGVEKVVNETTLP